MEVGVLVPDGRIVNVTLKSNELESKILLNCVLDQLQLELDCRKYFGLLYVDKEDGGLNWLLPDDKIKNFVHLHGRVKQYELSVQVYPNEPELVFCTAESRRLFRQYLKILFLNNKLGCDTRTHAYLDAMVVQAETGDFQENDLKYLKRISKFEVVAPTFLIGSATPITENEYMKMVRMQHRKFAGVRPSQADVLFLNEVKKVPFYGYVIYKIYDKINGSYNLALSQNGIHFAYEETLDIYQKPRWDEIITWGEVIFFEVEGNKANIGIMKPEFQQRSFKIDVKFGKKAVNRLITDFSNHKAIFQNIKDGHGIFDSRKEARNCYKKQIPRKLSAWTVKVQTVKTQFDRKFSTND